MAATKRSFAAKSTVLGVGQRTADATGKSDPSSPPNHRQVTLGMST